MSEEDAAIREYADKLDPEYKWKAGKLIDADPETLSNIVQCAFLAGMQLCIRICRNRAGDCRVSNQDDMEAENCAGLIRSVQVEIGAGRMPRPKFTKEELEEMDLIA